MPCAAACVGPASSLRVLARVHHTAQCGARGAWCRAAQRASRPWSAAAAAVGGEGREQLLFCQPHCNCSAPVASHAPASGGWPAAGCSAKIHTITRAVCGAGGGGGGKRVVRFCTSVLLCAASCPVALLCMRTDIFRVGEDWVRSMAVMICWWLGLQLQRVWRTRAAPTQALHSVQCSPLDLKLSHRQQSARAWRRGWMAASWDAAQSAGRTTVAPEQGCSTLTPACAGNSCSKGKEGSTICTQ